MTLAQERQNIIDHLALKGEFRIRSRKVRLALLARLAELTELLG